MIVYSYIKCSTCQKALRYLKEKKIAFIQKEITDVPPSIKELKEMLDYQSGNLKKIFNTSGMLYKELHLSEKLMHMPLDQALKLLHQHGMLVKRPFIIANGFGLLGFKEAEWDHHFKR